MLNAYLAEFLMRERATEGERRARIYAALHPIAEEWTDRPSDLSQSRNTPAELGAAKRSSGRGRRCERENDFRSAEAWTSRRACRMRRQHPSHQTPNRSVEAANKCE